MITLTATITTLDGTVIPIDYRQMLSLERSVFDRKDLELPSYGIISNNGSMSFVDYDGTIKSLAQNRQLTTGMEINLILKNTTSNLIKQIGEYFTDKWNYDLENKRANVNFTDGLEILQKTSFSGVVYDYEDISKNFEWVYRTLYEATISNTNLSMKSFAELDASTQSRLSELHLKYPFINENNLWALWNNFGIATQTHIFKNIDGIITCKYLGGN